MKHLVCLFHNLLSGFWNITSTPEASLPLAVHRVWRCPCLTSDMSAPTSNCVPANEDHPSAYPCGPGPWGSDPRPSGRVNNGDEKGKGEAERREGALWSGQGGGPGSEYQELCFICTALDQFLQSHVVGICNPEKYSFSKIVLREKKMEIGNKNGGR